MKPVMWINEYDEIESFNPDNRQDWIPLYTHPVKELTDEEIIELWWQADITDDGTVMDFARAILRKASGEG